VSITLREVTKDNVRTLCDLRVDPAQEQLVAGNAYTIAESAYEDHEVLLRGIYDGDEPVGLVGLVRDDATTWYMARLMVAAGHQRRGIGRRTMELVVDEVRARGGHVLLTSYAAHVDGNAGPFYAGLGFAPTGDFSDGEPVVRIDLR
jgi:diamine N-acetyltransferase